MRSPLAADPGPILVVDDDRKIVGLVRTYLEREGYRVVAATDGRAALAAVAREMPALVVLDMMLPELDGLEVIRAVRKRDRTPIVVLSARGGTADRIAGLDAGADDYLPKPFSPAELVLRVKRVLERSGRVDGGSGEVAPRPPIAFRDLVLDRDRFEATRDGQPIPLTTLEFRLLAALLEADGRVLSRERLLDAVYGQDDGDVLDRTIDVHIGRLRDKLGDDADHPRYVATVRGVGYRAAPMAAAHAGRDAASTTGSFDA
ncbi:MAG: response regulator transcription factor [Chloroflexi bacterium]|nr:response regulator transcription factor [Chloroflexota bacterium]